MLTTLSHGSLLILAKQHRYSTYKQRLRLWYIHFLINGLLWTLLTLWIAILQLSHTNTTFLLWSKGAGIILAGIGIFLSASGLRTLGLNQAMEERFFFPEKRTRWINSGIHKYLRNPIYDGFVLIFIGLGLWREITVDFYLAIASFLFLNLLLATTEKL